LTNSWERRFPNPHTRPDTSDPLTAKVRADSKAIFGFDPLDTAVSTADLIRDLRRRLDTPEYQEGVAEYEREQRRLEAQQQAMQYERQLERLSPEHVDAVTRGCDAELKPISTTEIQRKALGWDGVQSIFLLGETGVGKTYTATWLAMRAVRGGRDCIATTATRISRASDDQLKAMHEVDVLIIDQLHTLESPSGKAVPAWQVAPVIDLIDYRHEQRLTTIAAGTVGAEKMFDEILGQDVRRRFPQRWQSESTEIRNEGSGK